MEIDGLEMRIAERITPAEDGSGCLLWTGGKTADGYGTVRVGKRTRLVHRHLYETFVGPIPDKHVLDHLLRDRPVAPGPCVHGPACCNWAHVQPVTITVNSQRVRQFHSTITHCPRGHAYAEHGIKRVCGDGRTRRYCRLCEGGRQHKHANA